MVEQALIPISKVTQFVKENPLAAGLGLGGAAAATTLGTIAVSSLVRGRKKRKKVRHGKAKTFKRRRGRGRGRRRYKGAHKARVRRGYDVVHKGKRRGISLKAIRGALRSPKTPPHLKKGLRKLLRRRARHTH